MSNPRSRADSILNWLYFIALKKHVEKLDY